MLESQRCGPLFLISVLKRLRSCFASAERAERAVRCRRAMRSKGFQS